MGAEQQRLFFVGCALHLAGHGAVQMIETRKWPVLPGPLSDPGRMLEHPAKRRHEAVAGKRIDLVDRHGEWSAKTIATCPAYSLLTPATDSSATGWRTRMARTAQKTRSGVAGLSSVTTPPFPKAAMASRRASRAEMASMRGGSPTALLPKTTPGSAERVRNST